MWTLVWAVVALYVVYGNNKFKNWEKTMLVLLICLITFPADFSSIGVMAILYMYKYRGELKKKCILILT